MAFAEEEEVKAAIGYIGTEHLLVQTVPPTSGFRAVTAPARREALKDPAERVHRQHPLLAITDLERKPAARILTALEVDGAAIREKMNSVGDESPA